MNSDIAKLKETINSYDISPSDFACYAAAIARRTAAACDVWVAMR